MRTYAALALVPLLLAACDSDSPTAPQDVAVPFETVLESQYSSLYFPLQAVLRGADEWTDVWKAIHADQSPVPQLPPIDFSVDMVVVVAAGSRPDGCYAIEVTGAVVRGNGDLELEVTETVPGPTCACTTALTQPVHVVQMSRLSGRATFDMRRSERRC